MENFMRPYVRKVADVSVEVDASLVKGRTVVITGGANGIGEAFVRAIAKAGGYVAFGDIDVKCGEAVAADYPGLTSFVKCDVTKFEEQRKLFEAGLKLSPNGVIDVVIANAGINANDSIFETDNDTEEVAEPKLTTWTVNGAGALYTTHLALHRFRRQHKVHKDLDQVLIFTGAGAGYIDVPTCVEYAGTKFALRTAMRNLRLTEWKNNIRFGYISPWYVDTKIHVPGAAKHMEDRGVKFATLDDLAKAALRIITDPDINGRTFMVLPRNLAPHGYLDLDSDEPAPGTTLAMIQTEFDKSLGMGLPANYPYKN